MVEGELPGRRFSCSGDSSVQMKPIDKKPLSQQVAERLAEEIETGRWQKRMPSCRALERLLGVSRRTIEGALDMLSQRGLLSPPNGWSSRRILQKIEIPVAVESRRIIFVGRVPLGQIEPLVRDTMTTTLQALIGRGYQAEYVDCAAIARPHSEVALDALLTLYPASRWIFIEACHDTIQWAASRRLSALLAGGEIRGRAPLPSVARAIASSVKDGVGRLLELGHKDIVIFSNGLGEIGRALILKEAGQAYQKAGVAFDAARTVPKVSWSTRDEFLVILELIFRPAPTAVIVPWSGPVSSIFGYCSSHGLQVPGDLSILVSELEASASWHVPAPSGYEVSGDSFSTSFIHWVEREYLFPREIVIKARFIAGETLAPPPVLRRAPNLERPTLSVEC